MDQYYKIQDPLINQQRGKKDNFLFTLISPLVKQINEQKDQLKNSDLQEFIIEESDCKLLIEQLNSSISKNSQLSKSELNNLIFRKFLLKRIGVCLIYQTLCDIVLMGRIIVLEQATNTLFFDEQLNLTFIYFMVLIVLSFMRTYLDSQISRYSNLLLMRLRVILTYLIYSKALRTQCLTTTQQNNSDSNNYVANINTLLTGDIDEIQALQFTFTSLWESILLITFCLIYLYQKDSHAGTIVVITIIVTQAFNLFVANGMIVADKNALQYKDGRVGLTTDIIEGIKQIKYLSWENSFDEKIMKFRKKEFLMMSVKKIFDGFCSIFWNNVSYVLLCAYLTTSLNNGQKLQDLNIFVLIAVFNTMTFPLGILPWCINSVLIANVSWKRIKVFLNTRDIDELNCFRLPYPKSIADTDVLIMEDLVFEWPTNSNNLEQPKNTKTQVEDIPQTQQFSLNIDYLKIKKNTLNFVIGQIGSGKSAFFNAILNELSKENQYLKNNRTLSILTDKHDERMLTISDQIIIKGTIGYCSQTTWVQNQTIRENILFGKPFEKELYNKIIQVCQIRKDLETFQKKDLHELGPEGKNISGGQKQRITLARALYQNADIYLFDDVFSSLDVHVADTIFKEAIIQYLLEEGKTVLFITSHYRYLNQVPNNINSKVIFIQNGNLVIDQDKIQEFIEEQTNIQQQKEKEEEEITHSIEQELDEIIPLLKKESSIKQEHHFNEQQINTENLEAREQGKISFDTYLTYLQQMGWVSIVFFVIINFMMQGCLTFIDFWLKAEVAQSDSWLHQITVYFNNDISHTLLILTGFSLLVTFVRAIFYVVLGLKAAWKLFKQLSQALMYSTMKFFDKTNAGRIVNRVQDDTFMIDDELPWTFHCLFENVSRVVGLSVGLLIIFPIFIVVLIGVIVLYLKLSKIYIKPNAELKRLKSVNNAVTLQIVNETLTGLKTIRALNKQEFFSTTLIDKLNNFTVADQCASRSKYWFQVRLNLLSNCIIICVIIIISVIMLLNLESYYYSCALALTYSIVVLESCYDLFMFYLRLETCVVSVERVRTYFNNPTENIDQLIGEEQKAKIDQIEKIYQQEFKFDHGIYNDHAIVFRNIFLTYDDPSNITKLALKNFNLAIKKGEKVAFVGRTGSGKTSILNILFGLYPYQSGSLEIKGKNISQMTLRELRQEMSVVPQFGFLYNASVKENLDPLNTVAKEEIEQLFQQTGFKLRGISEGEDQCNSEFIVAQNGSNLSNGEKQVLNFLRIMLMNKQIVCLDEATSNMDPQTDQLLHDLLFKYAENRTLLVITHRLENIAIYDKIVVMEQGEIVEYGSYQDLLKIEGGFFNKLMSHHKQSK